MDILGDCVAFTMTDDDVSYKVDTVLELPVPVSPISLGQTFFMLSPKRTVRFVQLYARYYTLVY